MIIDYKKTAEISALKEYSNLKACEVYQPSISAYIATVSGEHKDVGEVSVSELREKPNRSINQYASKAFARFVFNNRRIEKGLAKARLR